MVPPALFCGRVKRWRHYQKGTAIVLASFGSVVAADRYEELRKDAEKRFSDADVFFSFSSRTILKRFREKGTPVESLPEVLARLDREGYRRIVVSSVNLFPTDEHEMVLKTVTGFQHFSPAAIRATGAIFTKTKNAGKILETISSELHRDHPAEYYLYIAHGSPYLDQGGAISYSYAGEFLSSLSTKNTFCTLEGTFPCSSLLNGPWKSSLNASGKRPGIVLVPLLLVSGRHFEEDIAEIQESLKDHAEIRIAPSVQGEGPFYLLEREDIRKVLLDEIDQEIRKIP